MEHLEIKIVITDGVKEAKTSVNVAEYKKMKSLSGVSLVDRANWHDLTVNVWC